MPRPASSPARSTSDPSSRGRGRLARTGAGFLPPTASHVPGRGLVGGVRVRGSGLGDAQAPARHARQAASVEGALLRLDGGDEHEAE